MQEIIHRLTSCILVVVIYYYLLLARFVRCLDLKGDFTPRKLMHASCQCQSTNNCALRMDFSIMANKCSRRLQILFVFTKSWKYLNIQLENPTLTTKDLYMVGSSISIFPIMMVGMMFVRPIRALFSMNQSKFS